MSIPPLPSAAAPPLSHHHHHHLLHLHFLRSIFSSSSSTSNTALLIAAIVSLLLVLLVVLLLHLYAKCFLLPHHRTLPLPPTPPNFRVPRDIAGVERESPSPPAKSGGGGGLDSSTVASIPLFVHRGGSGCGASSVCVICLSAFQNGDVGRTLPTCTHRSFHVDCIDTWLMSHSTCPVCRAPVAVPATTPDGPAEMDSVVIEVVDGNGCDEAATETAFGSTLRRMLSKSSRPERRIHPSSSSSSFSSLSSSLANANANANANTNVTQLEDL